MILLRLGLLRSVPSNELVFSGIALGFADETSEVNELRSERGPLKDWATFFPGDWDKPRL